MPRIFISHSTKDNDITQWFEPWLREHGFEKIFLDYDRFGGIPAGADWEQHLYGELQRATALVLILTEHWFESKWCFAEFTQARIQGKSIVPLVVRKSGDAFPGDNLQKIWLEPDREDGLARLLDRLQALALEGPASFTLPPGRVPYPGLMSFDREDAAVFFGREPEVRRAVEHLERLRVRGGARMLLVHGESGSGKSSILKAGLLPQLGLRGDAWLVLPEFRPGDDPADELRRLLLELLGPEKEAEVKALLETPSVEAAKVVIDALQAQNRRFRTTILLAIDQFEEAFTLPTEQAQAHFVKVLAALLDPSQRALAVATLRTSDLSRVTARLEELKHDEFLVGPFPIKALPDVIRKPAEVAGIRVDQDLVERIKADAGTSDTLPLLAFLLRRLHDLHAGDNHITLAEYESMGDARAELSPLESCIRDAADEAIVRSQANEVELAALREAFVLGLVRINDSNLYVRRALPAAEVPQGAESPLRALVEERLMIRRDDGSLEVAHEALFRVWELLKGWLRDEQEFLQGLGRIHTAATDWRSALELSKKDTLLNGLLLSRAEAWLQQHPNRFDPSLRNFIECSTNEKLGRERARRSLQRAIVGISTAAAIIFSVTATIAKWGWESADKQRSQANEQKTKADRAANEAVIQEKLAKKAAIEAKEKSDAAQDIAYRLSIRAAAEKIARDQIPDAAALLDEIPKERQKNWEWGYLRSQCDNWCLRYHAEPHDRIMGLNLNPDASKAMTTSGKGSIKIWDTSNESQARWLSTDAPALFTARAKADWDFSAEPIVASAEGDVVVVRVLATGTRQFALDNTPSSIQSLSFAPDGSRILVVGSSSVGLWNAKDGQPIQVAFRHESKSSIISGAFSNDGKKIMAFSKEEVLIWDAANGAQLRKFSWPSVAIDSVVLSPDGSSVAIAARQNFENTGEFTQSFPAEAAPGFVVLSNTTGDQPVKKMFGFEAPVVDVAFADSGKRLITASADGALRIWNDGIDEIRKEEFEVTSNTRVRCDREVLAVLVTGLRGQSLILSSFNLEILAKLSDSTGAVTEMATWPAVDGVFLTSSDEGIAYVWNIDTLTQREELPDAGRGVVILAADCSPFRWIEHKANTSNLNLREANGRTTELPQSSKNLRFSNFSANGSRVLSVREDDSADIFDVPTGRSTPLNIREYEEIANAEFSPDGRLLAIARHYGGVFLLDDVNSEPRLIFEHEESILGVPAALAFSGDGTKVASAGDAGVIAINESKSGKLLKSLDGIFPNFGVRDRVAISLDNDGSHLAVARGTEFAEIHEWGTKRTITLRGHGGPVTGANFSSNGERIVTSSIDGNLIVWDVASGSELVRLETGLTKPIISAKFADGGKSILATDGDNIEVWHSDSSAKRYEMKKRSTGN